MSRPFFGRTFFVSGAVNRYLPVAVGRPRTTSFLVQVCTSPQCEQVNFCVFTVSLCQCFSSTVFPVSVSFEVEGQRTSRLLIPGRVFACFGGSKKKRVAILKSINNARSGGVVGRHFHLHAVSDCYPNKSLAHSAGYTGENEMLVGKSDAKYGPRRDRRDRASSSIAFSELIISMSVGVCAHSEPGAQVLTKVDSESIFESWRNSVSHRESADLRRAGALR